jgi:hypothetical protein
VKSRVKYPTGQVNKAPGSIMLAEDIYSNAIFVYVNERGQKKAHIT